MSVKKRIARIVSAARAHKFITAIVIIVVVYGGYSIFIKGGSGNTETRYVLGTVSRGTIIASLSASGQVSSSDQIDVKPKAAGDVTWVGVKAGDTVYAGQALASIDSTDAKQAIADAEQSLAQAKLQYQKDSAQAPIDYQKTLEALADAKQNLETTYNDTFNSISDTYLALPSIMTSLDSAVYGYDLSANKNQSNIDALPSAFIADQNTYEKINTIADIAERDYKIARGKYDTSLAEYKQLTRYSATSTLEASLADSIDTTTAIAQALQSMLNLLDTAIDAAGQSSSISLSSSVNSIRSSAQSNLSTVNSRLSSLLSQQSSIDASKKTIRDDQRSIDIYTIGNPNGDNPISLQSSAQSIANQERNLQTLKDNLADYTITSPFSGQIASLSLKTYDSVTTGSTVATVITKQKIATLSLNEVDVANIAVGNKATLTFDAIDGLSLTGEVSEINPIGTVSQGVVSYAITIAFDTQDARVKPGMTVNASIVSDVHTDVLTVPSSAVKTQGGSTYVEIFNPPLNAVGGSQGVTSTVPPTQVPVTIGISDDTNTEIISGLNEGDQIIVRTTTGTAVTTQTQTAPSLFGGGTRGGGTRGGGTFIRN